MKILIVDDDRFQAMCLERVLSDAGYMPTVAANGVEALRILREGSHQLVISDWIMPEMDGLELCRRIRASDFQRYIYVVLLTSRDGAENAVEGLNAGADEFVSKPFVPAELLARVRAGERLVGMETREVTIYALAKLAESRDPDTGAHLERVREYARLLATSMRDKRPECGVTDEFVHLLSLTSPLHDIGKVGIPDRILLKPGPLTEDEFEIMKTHTTIGAQTLESVSRQFPGVPFLQMAFEIALSHHERFDGTGYPGGLKGEDIPLAARITALADVFDAITSQRVYKKAFSVDYARSVILSERGKHFDPRLVDLFLRNESQFVDIRRRHPDPGQPLEAGANPALEQQHALHPAGAVH